MSGLLAVISVATAAVAVRRATRVGQRPALSPPARALRSGIREQTEAREGDERDAVTVADELVRALGAGHSLQTAADEPGAHPALVWLGRQLRAGRRLEDALVAWPVAQPVRGLESVASALRIGTRVGGSAVGALEGVASALRHRVGLRAEARALVSTANASAVVLAGCPVVFAGLTVAGGGDAAEFLLASPIGIGCLVAATLLDAAGLFWMRLMVASVAS